MRLANFSCDNAGLVHQGTLHQARGPHPVHKAIAYTSADQPVKNVAGSGKVYMDFGTAMEIIVVTVNAYGSTRSNTQIMLRVVSLEEEEDILACKSKGSVLTPLGLCGVTAGSTVAVAFEPARPGSPPPTWRNSGGIGTGACGDLRRRSCCLGSLRVHSLWVP